MDENEVSGGDEDYGMRSVGLIHAVRPPCSYPHELNAFDRPDLRPAWNCSVHECSEVTQGMRKYRGYCSAECLNRDSLGR